MKSKLILCLALFLSAALLGGCASRQPIVMSGYQINDVHMLKARDGWAEAYGPSGHLILKTTDGGQAWRNVTPRPVPYDLWACEFASRKTAWITIHTNTGAGLLMTTNGGISWARTGTSFDYFTEASDVRFVNGHLGVAQVGDYAAGSLYYSFYQTLDGGLNWKPIAVTSPNSMPEDRGEVHLSSYDGDRMTYCPRKTFIVAYGESGDSAPNGYVRLSISKDFGKSWRQLHLLLPDARRNEYTSPLLPVFFGERDGVLPVELFTQNAISNTFHDLLFYRTEDGGESWSVSGAVAINKRGMAREDCDVISAKDIVVRDDGVLNVTHDGGKTWVGIMPNIDLGREDPKSRRDMSRMNFADADHGWMIICDYSTSWPYDDYWFYRTTDGGQKWTEIPLRILQ